MASSDNTDSEPVTGQPEVREPSKGIVAGMKTPEDGIALHSPPALQPTKKTITSTATHATASTSTTNSPKPSRETSPIRPQVKPGPSSTTKGPRSRKNSQDFSPNRNPSGSGSTIPSVPSAAAVQRALSAIGASQLPSVVASETSVDTLRPQKTKRATPGENTPHWPTSPRLKSPPPSATSTRPSVFSPRKPDLGPLTPSIFVERPTPSSTPLGESSASTIDIEGEDTTPRSGMRTPGRGVSGTGSVLETVQESSLPATPAIGTVQGPSSHKPSDDARPEPITENPMDEAFAKSTQTVAESGSESGGNKSGGAKTNDKGRRKAATAGSSTRSNTVFPRQSLTHLNSTRAKMGGEGSVRNMTVETETVSSIPQVAVGGGAGERGIPGRTDAAGSVRLKPSTETIRPKKEKKKVVRKTPSLNAGNASSKADIFEAKVASAVDEANSSDSEETFVYESNPPDTHPSRPRRYHSRTPSTTSMASQADQYGGRSRQSLGDGRQSIAGKRSMKFASNAYYSSGIEGDVAEHAGRGGPAGSGRAKGGSPVHQHHHIGRYGRGGGGGHTSLFDTDSPFAQAAKPLRPTGGNNSRPSQRSASPRNPHSLRLAGTSKKSSYDIDDEGADDERTPLFNSARSHRTRSGRRPNSGSILQSEYAEDKERGCCWRLAGWIFGGVVVLLVSIGVVGGLLGVSKSLHDVFVKDIENVLASEQEIMLDLRVHAVSSNWMAITISHLDVNIFAKSKHVVPNSLWANVHDRPSSYHGRRKKRALEMTSSGEKRPTTGTSQEYHMTDGVDEGNDPIEDPEGDSQTMLLGRIFEFDSPLIFEGCLWGYCSLSSVGGLRLAKPGNKTEEGGTERWEKVIQYPFELIVRGVLKYQLRLSSTVRTASIGASVIVHPDEGVDAMGRMRTSETNASYPPGSNVVLHRGGPYVSKAPRIHT